MRKVKSKSKTLSLIFILFLLNVRNIESSYQKENEHTINEQIIGYLTWKLDKTRIPTQSPIKITKNNHLTSLFGYRFHPIKKEWLLHEGVDLSGKIKTPIYSTGFGVVIESKYSQSYGNIIKIKHNDTIETVYAHLYYKYVQVGDIVYQGQKIGLLGNTGLSTGAHLHYEVRIKNNPQNPLNFFDFCPPKVLLANK